MKILSYEEMKEFFGQKEADKSRYVKSVCPNCNKKNEVLIKYDKYGIHAICECGSSYDVDGEILLTLWLYDFSPNSSIDDIEEHHQFIKQVVYHSIKEFKNKYSLLLDTYEGCTYTLECPYRYDKERILGVFSSDSIEDDIAELRN